MRARSADKTRKLPGLTDGAGTTTAPVRVPIERPSQRVLARDHWGLRQLACIIIGRDTPGHSETISHSSSTWRRTASFGIHGNLMPGNLACQAPYGSKARTASMNGWGGR